MDLSFVSLSTLNCLYSGFLYESHLCQLLLFFLLQSGCDVNIQSYSGNTALHGACGRGQVDTVRLLLKSGADSSLKNYHNDTPVMVAKNKKVSEGMTEKESMHNTTDLAEIPQFQKKLLYCLFQPFLWWQVAASKQIRWCQENKKGYQTDCD